MFHYIYSGDSISTANFLSVTNATIPPASTQITYFLEPIEITSVILGPRDDTSMVVVPIAPRAIRILQKTRSWSTAQNESAEPAKEIMSVREQEKSTGATNV